MTAPFRGSTSDVTRQQLRARRYQRLSRDVYALRPAEVDLRLRCAAARLVFPDAVVCLATAGMLLRLPVDDDGHVHLARGPAAPRSERVGITVHRLPMAEDEVVAVEGMPVADGPRVLADLSGSLSLEKLVALGDVILRRWGPERVAAAVDRHGRRRGVVLLRHAHALLDPGSDSPAETRMRLRLHAAGFVALQHQITVTDDDGGWLGVPDLADPLARVALQHEGVTHFEQGVRQRIKDLDRDEVIRQYDWEVVTSTALDDARPDRLVAKVTSAYRRAAGRWGDHVLPPHLR